MKIVFLQAVLRYFLLESDFGNYFKIFKLISIYICIKGGTGRWNWFFSIKNLANQGFKDIIQISQIVDLAFSLRDKCVKPFFVCTHSLTHKRHKRTYAKMVYLSLPRFYFEINLHFNITCIISI
jgi:hypothetical protein